MTVAVVAATTVGRRLAADIAEHLDASLLTGPPGEAVARTWPAADQLVLVMATGAAVRLIAPRLTDKAHDPGVVCVDDAARFVVPLTGGHEGGANDLAARLAEHLGAQPIVTTASEARALPALEALGDAHGVHAEGDLAAVGGALVSGEPVHLLADARWPLGPLPGHVTEVEAPTAPLLWLTDRRVDPPPRTVLLRPPSLVVGVGSSRGVTAEEVGTLLDRVLATAGLSPLAVDHLATVDVKAQEPGIRAAAAARGWPLVALPADRLADTEVPNPSPVVRDAVGTPSVAEAAALHRGGQLVAEKTATAMATAAVARRPARGHVALVSLGPGDPDLVPPRARDALRHAEVVVGYGPYVDQAAAFVGRGAQLERYPIGTELRRTERALELARAGRAVAVVGSGDVGVYALASPVLEAAGPEVDVTVVPGVTAALAAGALLGAPLGHDHCCISLSDLLTPWELIRRRIEAAGAADFVVTFYNPRSRNRDWQLEAARSILLAHRPAGTPVGVVRDADRSGQQVTLTTLGELDVTTVGMTTVVVVGNSRSHLENGRLVTPRGYRSAADPAREQPA